MAHDKGPSGKVGAQEAGRGSQVGREAEFRTQDNVDAGVGRSVGRERENAVENKDARGNLDRVDNDNPLAGAVDLDEGGLDAEGEPLEDRVATVEGVRSGGAAAND